MPQDDGTLRLFRTLDFVMVVLGTTIHEFGGRFAVLHGETRGWSDKSDHDDRKERPASLRLAS